MVLLKTLLLLCLAFGFTAANERRKRQTYDRNYGGAAQYTQPPHQPLGYQQPQVYQQQAYGYQPQPHYAPQQQVYKPPQYGGAPRKRQTYDGNYGGAAQYTQPPHQPQVYQQQPQGYQQQPQGYQQQLQTYGYQPQPHYAPQQQVYKPAEEKKEQGPHPLTLLLKNSKFECGSKSDGYYADRGVGCQAFHYCVSGQKHSMMCPAGTVFHQVHLNCVPKAQDICNKADKFYFVNDYLNGAHRYYPENYAVGDPFIPPQEQKRAPPTATYGLVPVYREQQPAPFYQGAAYRPQPAVAQQVPTHHQQPAAYAAHQQTPVYQPQNPAPYTPCVSGQKHSMMCPTGTVFHQVHLNCVPQDQDISYKADKSHFVNDYLNRPLEQKGPNNTVQWAHQYYPENYAVGDPSIPPQEKKREPPATTYGLGPACREQQPAPLHQGAAYRPQPAHAQQVPAHYQQPAAYAAHQQTPVHQPQNPAPYTPPQAAQVYQHRPVHQPAQVKPVHQPQTQLYGYGAQQAQAYNSQAQRAYNQQQYQAPPNHLYGASAAQRPRYA